MVVAELSWLAATLMQIRNKTGEGRFINARSTLLISIDAGTLSAFASSPNIGRRTDIGFGPPFSSI
jgi:hypothetical protein